MAQTSEQNTASAFSSRPDIVIVGGGASGLSVLLQLIERVKDGKQIRDVVLLERSAIPGPGLPYSNSCAGTIINMHSDSMGLYFDKPLDFTRWRKNLADGSFPSRETYGQYLEATMCQAIQQARCVGLNICVLHQEANEIDRLYDDTLLLTLGNGLRLISSCVILALGNFTSACNAHLLDLPGFFPSPWPLSQFESLPKDAPVLVVGSRLSAVDIASYLSDKGHEGTITFMSRSGRLPKVQGGSSPYSRRYALHDLARQAEASPEESLFQLMSGLTDELSHATDGDWSWLVDNKPPLKQLQDDIRAVQNDQVRWQEVLRGTAPLMEKYWNSLSPKGQQLFMTKFNSAWMRFRHGMPMQNAQKLLKMLQQSRLRVVTGSYVSWDGIFKAETSLGLIETPYVIEATGQECRLDRIRSPLLQSALRKQLLKPHPVGGIDVDFDTLCASPGIYAIGSLTRGTHFYVSAIDRVAAHAARISCAITQEPYPRSLHVAIFCGSDLFSHLMVSKLVAKLLGTGHVPFVFLPKHKGARKSSLFELRELAFFERELLQEHVIPYFKGKCSEGAAHMTVQQMKDAYGILVEETDIIRYFAHPRRLLNLHPGTLPAYRGVMTTVRAMRNKETHFGYSLHDIDENWDSGDVIDIRKHPIDYSKSMLQYMADVYSMGVEVAADAIDKIARGRELRKRPQNADESGYYTFPTENELADIRENGIRLVDGEAIIGIIVESFAPSKEQDEFRTYLRGIVKDWYHKNLPASPVSYIRHAPAQFAVHVEPNAV
ncbi:hypothetical protein ED733_004917 [Metarhizium rileyi]|uniref:Uncharacterized protein n=1 Tax=Metarhizium rileyi (strain RCEF 4871) TaxID=1649241 RepID=A0A5C6G944_METRR|nr:hypothetical protein ED733_004917 [Metarhizium rileyi]